MAPGDVWALVSALLRLLADEGLRARLGEAARARVREQFDRERLISRIERLYQEAC
jgi:glycosyltransferase involved in cell wall biosynthesis